MGLSRTDQPYSSLLHCGCKYPNILYSRAGACHRAFERAEEHIQSVFVRQRPHKSDAEDLARKRAKAGPDFDSVLV